MDVCTTYVKSKQHSQEQKNENPFISVLQFLLSKKIWNVKLVFNAQSYTERTAAAKNIYRQKQKPKKKNGKV